jgi:hypothetical protein
MIRTAFGIPDHTKDTGWFEHAVDLVKGLFVGKPIWSTSSLAAMQSVETYQWKAYIESAP